MDYVSVVVDYVYNTEGPFHLISKNNDLNVDIDEDFMKDIKPNFRDFRIWDKLDDIRGANS